MKKLNMKLASYALIALALAFAGCGEDEPETGFLKGLVTGNGAAIEGAQVVVFNANTNAPTGHSGVTDMDGNYEFELMPDNYQLKVYANGFNPNPGNGPAITVAVKAGVETPYNVEMDPSEVSNGGMIEGSVLFGEEGASGALVVAQSGSISSSFVTNSEGQYYLYNLPAGNYTLMAYKQNFNSSTLSADVTAGNTTIADALNLTEDAGGSISGSITLLATSNAEVDVALVHPVSEETIPGLSVMTSDQNYEISGVPNGEYFLRATYANDGKAMDPDWLLKNPGALDVDFSGSAISLDFSITGAVSLSEPTNPADDPTPVVVDSDSVVFSWVPYSSTSDYVIEVFDAKGNSIWGGFSADYTSKKVIISDGTSIGFNSDGMATGSLEDGKTYTWKIYASKNDTKEPTGWKLISMSEEQMGIFRVELE